MPNNAIESEITETMLMPAARIAEQVSLAHTIASRLGMDQDAFWLLREQGGYLSSTPQTLDKLLGQFARELGQRISSYRLRHGTFYVQGSVGGPMEFTWPHFFWESVGELESKCRQRLPSSNVLWVHVPLEFLAGVFSKVGLSEFASALNRNGAQELAVLFPPNTLDEILAGLQRELLLFLARARLKAQGS